MVLAALATQVALTANANPNANAQMSQFMTEQQLVQSGKESFVRNCTGCHGMEGKGDGPAAAMLNPKPRNLVEGAFKFRTTPLGSLPTTDDLIRTIDQGIPGSSMPSFRLVNQQEKLALALFVKSLRADWKKMEDQPLPIPAQAPREIFASKATLLASAAAGQKLFQEACMTCHGIKGLGDGDGAVGLTDADGRPIKPANLTALRVKSGRTARAVFKDIATGLDGTPMPSFWGTYNEKQIWDLTAYIFFLRGQTAGIYDPSLELASFATTPTTGAKKK